MLIEYFNRKIKVFLVLILNILVFFSCYAEEFRFTSLEKNVTIPDFNSSSKNNPLIINIPVNLENKKLDSAFGIEKVQLAISHKKISDIKVVLKSPDGTEVWITNRNGGNGANYIETVFSDYGFNGPINQGSPPFLGSYIPEGVLAHFNNGQRGSGNWTLEIYDLNMDITGTFHSVILFFSNQPAKSLIGNCTFENPKNCQCSSIRKKCALLPDLEIIPSFTQTNFTELAPTQTKPGMIKFGVAVFNKGLGPLEIIATGKWECEDGSSVQNEMELCSNKKRPKQLMKQVIYNLNRNRIAFQERNANFIYYDDRPGHDHYHADNFVSYTLLKKDSLNDDFKTWEVIGKGVKASFCIWNLSYCRSDLNNCIGLDSISYSELNLQNYGLGGKYRNCNEKFQGLSVGGIDSYGQNYEGQTIEIPSNCKNGEYYLLLEVDPENFYLESDDENNFYLMKIELKLQN